MRRKLNTTLGFYSPSFLRMHIATKKSLINIATLNDEQTEATYLHEYVHFMQDITTSYGLANINVVADYMRFVNRHIISLPLGSFPVPIRPIPFGADNVDNNLKLQKVYNGDGDDDSVRFSSHRIFKRTMNLPVGQRDIPSVEVHYLNKKGDKKKFEFGALCIVESMAFIIESECYPNCPEPPDIPYKAAEKLVDFINPQFGSNRLNVLALCDASLKTFHSGYFFYDILIKIRDKKISFEYPEEVYAFCSSHHDPFVFDGANDLRTVFIKSKNLAIEQLRKYFNDKHFAPVQEWLENMVLFGTKYRLNNERFPVEIARGGPIKKNRVLLDFLEQVGTPLITNELFETTLFAPKNNNVTVNFPLIWALDQIHNVFWGIQRNCELVELCISSGVPTDYRCGTSPWERAADALPNCPFALMWRHWKLAGYFPIK